MPHEISEIVEQVRQLPPSAGKSVVVGIDGCGGSGKSTLAGRLSELLPGSQVVHTDDFASWDVPIDWWPRLLDEVLIPLSQTRAGKYRRYDWVSRELAEWHEVAAPIVILEGVSATRREFRPYLACRIWVECDAETRLKRGLERDGAEALEQWLSWMKAEDEYVADHRPLDVADFIVQGV